MINQSLTSITDDVRSEHFGHVPSSLVEALLDLHLQEGDDQALVAETRRLLNEWVRRMREQADD